MEAKEITKHANQIVADTTLLVNTLVEGISAMYEKGGNVHTVKDIIAIRNAVLPQLEVISDQIAKDKYFNENIHENVIESYKRHLHANIFGIAMVINLAKPLQNLSIPELDEFNHWMDTEIGKPKDIENLMKRLMGCDGDCDNCSIDHNDN